MSHIPLGWPGWHPWSPPALLVTGKPDGLQLGPQVGADVCRSRAERAWSRVLPLLVSAENYSPKGRPPRLGREIPNPPTLASAFILSYKKQKGERARYVLREKKEWRGHGERNQSAERGILEKALGQAERGRGHGEKKAAGHRRGLAEISQRQRPWEQAHRQA